MSGACRAAPISCTACPSRAFSLSGSIDRVCTGEVEVDVAIVPPCYMKGPRRSLCAAADFLRAVSWSAGLVARNPGLVIREDNTLQDSNPQPEGWLSYEVSGPELKQDHLFSLSGGSV